MRSSRPVLLVSMGLLASLLAGMAPLGGGMRARAGERDREVSERLLFDSQSLVNIEITLPSEDWAALRGQARDFGSSFTKGLPENPYTYFSGSLAMQGILIPKASIRKKGFFGSMDQERPSLTVKIDGDVRQKLGGSDRLTLNNNKQDRAFVSQHLAYSLFRAAGLPAPRCALAKVTVNGEYLGIYTNVESIRKPFLKHHFDGSGGTLFEGTFPTDFYPDWIDRFDDKSKEDNADRKRLRRLAELLASPAPLPLDELRGLVDLDEFLTHWALESLIGFWDGYAGNQNNFFLYESPRDSKFHFIPWGADFALSDQFQFGAKSIKAKGILAYRLYQEPEFKKRYYETLHKLLDTVWKEQHLLAEVDRVKSLVKDHLHATQAKGFEEAVEGTRTFIQHRREQILAEIKDGPVEVPPPGKPMYMKQVGRAVASFKTQWSDKADTATADSGEATLTLEVNDESFEWKQLGAAAEPGRPFGPPARGAAAPLPPALVFVGKRASDDQLVRLSLFFADDQFRPDPVRTVSVQGFLQDGAEFRPGAMRMVRGTAHLDAAARVTGAPVSGSVDLQIYEMKNGFGGGRR